MELRKRVIKYIVAIWIKYGNTDFKLSPKLSYSIQWGKKFGDDIIDAIGESLKKFLNTKYEKIDLPNDKQEYINFILGGIKNELYDK